MKNSTYYILYVVIIFITCLISMTITGLGIWAWNVITPYDLDLTFKNVFAIWILMFLINMFFRTTINNLKTNNKS